MGKDTDYLCQKRVIGWREYKIQTFLNTVHVVDLTLEPCKQFT